MLVEVGLERDCFWFFVGGTGTARGIACEAPEFDCYFKFVPEFFSEDVESCPRDPEEAFRMGDGLN